MRTSPPAPAPRLGIVMLDTQFPRLRGDIGAPSSWRVPVLARVVPGALPREVVASAQALRAGGWGSRFVDAARALAAEGAGAIVTSCGFLVLLQRELQDAVDVPVISSALCWLPALLGDAAPVAVLTADAASLGTEHLRAAGVPASRDADVLIEGMPRGGEFERTVLGNQPTLDAARVRDEAVAAALVLRRRCAQARHLVLECTNLPPYAAAIAAATGFRVHSLLDWPALRDWAAPEPGDAA